MSSLSTEFPQWAQLCEDIDINHPMLQLPKAEYRALCQGAVLFVISVIILRKVSFTSEKECQGLSARRLAINIITIEVLFSLTALLHRFQTSTKEVCGPLPYISDNGSYPFEKNWSLLRDMFYVSHQHWWPWLSHVCIHCGTFWLALAPNWHTFLKAIAVVNILTIIGFMTHGATDSSSYCIRNSFQHSWFHESVQNIVFHSITEIPISFLTLIGL